MCTLVLAWQVFDVPVVAAANRDEAVDRDSEPPAVRDWEPRVVAPRDAEAGGTWIGYNECGVVAAVTNRWADSDLDGERSRGLLVRDALHSESAEDAARYVEEAVEADAYEGFNLVLADDRAAIYVEWDGRLAVANFDPGVHVVVNVGADGRYRIPGHRAEAGEAQAANADRVSAALRPEPGEDADAWLDRAADVVSDHEYGVCVHGDGFGTRSSSLLAVGPSERRYRFADGPPCETVFRPVEGQV